MSPGKMQKVLTGRAAWLKARLLRHEFPSSVVGHAAEEKDALKAALVKLGLFDKEFYEEEIERSTAALLKRAERNA